MGPGGPCSGVVCASARSPLRRRIASGPSGASPDSLLTTFASAGDTFGWRSGSGTGWLVENSRDRRRRRVALKRGTAGDHLVQQGAEREDVAASVERLAVDLFGRHVWQGAGNRASADERRRRRTSSVAARCPLGEPEVEQRGAGGSQHHVAGLEIAMHEAVLVRVSERVGRLRRDLDRVVRGNRPSGQAAGQRFAFHQFHDEVIEAAVVAHVEDAADVRVVEARDRLRLAMEQLAPLVAQAVGLDQTSIATGRSSRQSWPR